MPKNGSVAQGPTRRRPGFEFRSFHVGFEANKLALR
jgi:hypothetical protein